MNVQLLSIFKQILNFNERDIYSFVRYYVLTLTHLYIFMNH